jgi:2-iminobutanoate/2-iminopropanoate deaminase
MKEQIFPAEGPPPVGPYSPAVRANGFVFVSGQGPISLETGEPLRVSIRDQVHQTIQNVELVLKAAGSSLDKVVKTTVYLRDISNFSAMNEVYGSYFDSDIPPARTTVQVANLPLEIDVEIEAIALE